MKRLLSVCLTFCMLFGTVFGLSLLTEATGSAVWDGSADTSWYNTTDTVFTLTDGADLAGFAAIVNGTAEGIEQTNFEGKTVRLGADIVLNDGDAKTWGPSTAGLQAFPMIGNLKGSTYAETDEPKYFAGEFDGQGYTISGLFINQKVNSRGEGSALFAAVYGSASLHDFSLVNSYIRNPNNYAAAAITAYVMPKSSAEADAFHIYNIYTDAIVTASNNKNFGIGGIVGRIGYAWNNAKINDYNTISSCVFAGTIIHTGTGLANAGGIIGDVYDHGVNVSDCLNLGIVQSVNNGNYIGGIVGRGNPNNSKITVTSCVNAVTPDTANATAAEILSMENKSPRPDFAVKDCFYVGSKYAVNRAKTDLGAKFPKVITATKVTAEQLTGLGVSGEITSGLSGWILRDGQVMIPAGAAAVVPSDPSHFAPVTEGGVTFRGVQNTEAKDGSFNLRFIGTVDSLHYSVLGYDLSCTWAEGSKPEAEFTTDTVYKTITATENGMTKQYTAEGFSAEYIWAVTVAGIPATGDMTFTVKPFSCDPEGNKTTVGVYTLVYRDGQFVSLTRQK